MEQGEYMPFVISEIPVNDHAIRTNLCPHKRCHPCPLLEVLHHRKEQLKDKQGLAGGWFRTPQKPAIS